ncbi:hypothetical protein FTUN_6993 [Frigoriglobus tundricola]|uniref:Uncharacterized protein n=1 Tax=Frigoriglobus tundricola TaxID=2774151 RepID=A0A6M5Z1S9_9BACT|nr:hypothetical protein FTUN_6993 [Frigoriglobus tundricola]
MWWSRFVTSTGATPSCSAGSSTAIRTRSAPSWDGTGGRSGRPVWPCSATRTTRRTRSRRRSSSSPGRPVRWTAAGASARGSAPRHEAPRGSCGGGRAAQPAAGAGGLRRRPGRRAARGREPHLGAGGGRIGAAAAARARGPHHVSHGGAHARPDRRNDRVLCYGSPPAGEPRAGTAPRPAVGARGGADHRTPGLDPGRAGAEYRDCGGGVRQRGALPSPRVAALTDAILAPRFPSGLVAVGAALLLAAGTAVALVAYPAPAPVSRPTEAAGANPIPAPAAAPAGPGAGDQTVERRAPGPGDRCRGPPGPSGECRGPGPPALVARGPRAPRRHGGPRDHRRRGRYALTVPADFATHYSERSVTLLVSGPGLPPTTKLVRLEAGTADVGVPATRTVCGVLVAPDGGRVPGSGSGWCGWARPPPNRCKGAPTRRRTGGRRTRPPTPAAGSRSPLCRRARTCGWTCGTTGSPSPPFVFQRPTAARCGSLWNRLEFWRGG